MMSLPVWLPSTMFLRGGVSVKRRSLSGAFEREGRVWRDGDPHKDIYWRPLKRAGRILLNTFLYTVVAVLLLVLNYRNKNE